MSRRILFTILLFAASSLAQTDVNWATLTPEQMLELVPFKFGALQSKDAATIPPAVRSL
jgi:hypothetical protein